jgi:thiamine pyrophosphokinase
MIDKVVIVANGEKPKKDKITDIIRDADYIIAADGGIHICIAFKIKPDCLIGDLDSQNIANKLKSEIQTIQLTEQYSTDLEKALVYAKSLSPKKIEILSCFGKRSDHTLTNLLLLHNQNDTIITMYDDYGSMQLFSPGKYFFKKKKGKTISLFALEPVTDIYLKGFKYRLKENQVGPAFIGQSNEIISNNAEIYFKKGALILYELDDLDDLDA